MLDTFPIISSAIDLSNDFNEIRNNHYQDVDVHEYLEEIFMSITVNCRQRDVSYTSAFTLDGYDNMDLIYGYIHNSCLRITKLAKQSGAYDKDPQYYYCLPGFIKFDIAAMLLYITLLNSTRRRLYYCGLTNIDLVHLTKSFILFVRKQCPPLKVEMESQQLAELLNSMIFDLILDPVLDENGECKIKYERLNLRSPS